MAPSSPDLNADTKMIGSSALAVPCIIATHKMSKDRFRMIFHFHVELGA
jgi:hypothetical protein